MSASITWLGHATIRLTLPDERVIMIDPWLTENPACPGEFANPQRCDIILLTHGHFDHIGDVARLVEQFNPVVVGNMELCDVLQKRIGKGQFSAMNTGGTQSVDGVSVTLTQALHSSGVAGPDGHIYAGMPNGVVVRVAGQAALYHAGDTDVFSDMRLIAELHAPKVCILPIGDHFTMGAAGAALAVEYLRPEVIIPVHYRTFPILAQSADDFVKALSSDYKRRVQVLDVGQALPWTEQGIT